MGVMATVSCPVMTSFNAFSSINASYYVANTDILKCLKV